MAVNSFETDLHSESREESLDETSESAQRAFKTAKQYLRNSGKYAGEIADEVTTFVQRDPWLAMGAAFALGYAIAQLIKRLK